MDDAYINVSEVNSFVFCRRAWHLAQQGAASSLQVERQAGTVAHHQHGVLVQATARNRRLALWLWVAVALLIGAALAIR